MSSTPRDPAGRFLNLDGSGPQPFRAILQWAVLDKVRGKRKVSPPKCDVPTVPVDRARIAKAPGPGEGAQLTWLGHASWLVQLDGVSLLIDPVLGDHIFPKIPRNGAPVISPN